MGGWRNWYQEVVNSKPLFLTIYTIVIIGLEVSSFMSSPLFTPPTLLPMNESRNWVSSPPPLSYVDSSHVTQAPSFSQLRLPTFRPQRISVKAIWEVPQTKKMPNLKTFQMTKELIEERVKDNVIILTFGNYAFMDFILTWVKHLTDLGLSNLIVGAIDTKLVGALYWKGVPVFDMGSHMSTIDVGRGSPTFHKMGREKAILIDSFLIPTIA